MKLNKQQRIEVVQASLDEFSTLSCKKEVYGKIEVFKSVRGLISDYPTSLPQGENRYINVALRCCKQISTGEKELNKGLQKVGRMLELELSKLVDTSKPI